mgnify:CR=1 FL=1
MEVNNLPKCQKCKIGDLIPLSDFGGQGAAIHYKAWVCTNPDCGFNMKIRNGDIYLNRGIVKVILKQAAGGCADLQKAAALGNVTAVLEMEKSCK